MSVYLLVYAGQIGALVRRLLPASDGTPEDDYPLAGPARRRPATSARSCSSA